MPQELYPGQAYWHGHSPNVKRAEENWMTKQAHTAALREALERVSESLQGILDIGKRDMSNPKYDGYFETATNALANYRALSLSSPIEPPKETYEKECSQETTKEENATGLPLRNRNHLYQSLEASSEIQAEVDKILRDFNDGVLGGRERYELAELLVAAALTPSRLTDDEQATLRTLEVWKAQGRMLTDAELLLLRLLAASRQGPGRK